MVVLTTGQTLSNCNNFSNAVGWEEPTHELWILMGMKHGNSIFVMYFEWKEIYRGLNSQFQP